MSNTFDYSLDNLHNSIEKIFIGISSNYNKIIKILPSGLNKILILNSYIYLEELKNIIAFMEIKYNKKLKL